MNPSRDYAGITGCFGATSSLHGQISYTLFSHQIQLQPTKGPDFVCLTACHIRVRLQI